MSDRRPIVVLAGRHRPHELLLLALSLILGLGYTLGAPPPQSAAAQMPPWLVAAWALGLAISGGVGLVAVLFLARWREPALYAEAGSMLIGAGAWLLAGGSVIAYAGTHGSLGIGFCAMATAANLWRAWQIWRELSA